MSVAMLQERPPYIRFEVGTREWRDNNGNPHVRDVENILVTPAGSKDVHVADADEWIKAREALARQNPPQFNPDWANRFRQSFELWRKGMAIPEDGVPIRTWPALSPSEVKRCIEANILTVEDLAVANENALSRLGMGGRVLKDRAAQWLTDRDGTRAGGEVAALRMQNEEQARQLAELTTQLKDLTARVVENVPKRRHKPEPDDGDVIR